MTYTYCLKRKATAMKFSKESGIPTSQLISQTMISFQHRHLRPLLLGMSKVVDATYGLGF